MRRLLLAAALLALLAPSAADAARFAVGLRPGVDEAVLRAELEARGLGRGESLAPLPAVLVDSPGRSALRGLPGAAYVERLGTRRPAFTPSDPFVVRQWYLALNRAYDAWATPPPLAPTLVAVIDSGVDAEHPELAARISEARTFVGGQATVDKQGHGTFVAGLIAAESDNGIGIAGLSPAAELLVAKVVTADRTIPVEAEAKAIRWAVDRGARVINMSLGGVRDPLDPSVDTYSPLEAAAIEYAVKQNVVVVAAVGNGDQAPASPWRYASYPAALPHVLGVSALTRTGNSPSFSNRDPIYNDIAAPGEDILSTFPRALTAEYDCVEQGYSSCGPDEYRTAEGTSFAAPQVAAAAATLLGADPNLRAEQVTALLQQTAVDVNAARGCKGCPLGRDRYTGWGRVDVTSALGQLRGQLPPRDRYEPNDDAAGRSTRIFGQRRRLEATLDYWDDQQDVYAVRLRKGQRVYAGIIGPPRTDVNLVLWPPGTIRVDDLAQQHLRVRQSARPGPREYLAFRAKRRGLYYLQVKMASGGTGRYRLTIVKT